jgi:hypothetical protein
MPHLNNNNKKPGVVASTCHSSYAENINRRNQHPSQPRKKKCKTLSEK